jgi:formate dehydrogenase subunit gamma
VDGIIVEPVYCLGLCASGPSAMAGDRVFGRLDEEAAVQLARSLKR